MSVNLDCREARDVLSLQGEIKILVMGEGVPQQIAGEVAGAVVDAFLRSPVATEAHRTFYLTAVGGAT